MQKTLAPHWFFDPLNESPVPTIEDFKGQVLLMLFFNIGCPSCLGRAIPFSKKLQDLYPGLKVLGVHTTFEGRKSSVEDINLWMDRLKVDYPVVLDQEHKTWSAYEAGGTPHWVIINSTGEIEKSIFGSMPNSLQRLDYALTELFETQ